MFHTIINPSRALINSCGHQTSGVEHRSVVSTLLQSLTVDIKRVTVSHRDILMSDLHYCSTTVGSAVHYCIASVDSDIIKQETTAVGSPLLKY